MTPAAPAAVRAALARGAVLAVSLAAHVAVAAAVSVPTRPAPAPERVLIAELQAPDAPATPPAPAPPRPTVTPPRAPAPPRPAAVTPPRLLAATLPELVPVPAETPVERPRPTEVERVQPPEVPPPSAPRMAPSGQDLLGLPAQPPPSRAGGATLAAPPSSARSQAAIETGVYWEEAAESSAPTPREEPSTRASTKPSRSAASGVAALPPGDAPTRTAIPRGGYQHRPSYPASARRLGVQGTTLLSVFVTADGRVGEVQVRQSAGHRDLDQAAVEAVRRWRFEPARRGTEAVAVWVTLPVEFRLR
jgi:protein TonB